MQQLLDSVIVIDHLNGIELATRYLSAHGTACAVSVITRAEAPAGFDNEHTALARELLDLFPTLPITLDIADRPPAPQRALESARCLPSRGGDAS